MALICISRTDLSSKIKKLELNLGYHFDFLTLRYVVSMYQDHD